MTRTDDDVSYPCDHIDGRTLDSWAHAAMVQLPIWRHDEACRWTPIRLIMLRRHAMDTKQPRYAPGDRVAVRDATNNWHNAPATVVRVVPIAQLSHQSMRYLYVLEMDVDHSNVYLSEEALVAAS